MAARERASYPDVIRGMAEAMEQERVALPGGRSFDRFEDLLVGEGGLPKVSLYYSLSRRSLVALPFGTDESEDRIVAPFNVDLPARGDVREACREHLRLTAGLVRHEALPNFAARAKAFASRHRGRARSA